MIFQTERLIIRDYTEADIDRVHELVQPPEIYRYQHWGPNSQEDTENFIKMAVAQQKENPRKSYEVSITDKASGDIVGAIGIRMGNYKKADIGYWVRHDMWGKGFATEATKALLKFGFEELGLNRIVATADPRNTASVNVLKKVGMKQEGLLKEDMIIRGEHRDSVFMAILKSEWG